MRTLTIADNWKDWKFGDTDAVMTFTALDDDKVPDFSDRTLTFKIASTLNNDLEHPKDFAATAKGYVQGKNVILKTEDVKQLTPGNYIVELWAMSNDTQKDAVYPSKGFAQFTIEENSMKVSDVTNIPSMTINAFWNDVMQKVGTLTKGAKGDPGKTPKIVIGSVTKLAPDAQPSATLVPLPSDPTTYTLNLQLPQGAQGIQGIQGDPGVGTKGLDGNNGLTPTIDPKTKHWMIGNSDTGVIAEGQPGKDADPSKYASVIQFNQLRQSVSDNSTQLNALQGTFEQASTKLDDLQDRVNTLQSSTDLSDMKKQINDLQTAVKTLQDAAKLTQPTQLTSPDSDKPKSDHPAQPTEPASSASSSTGKPASSASTAPTTPTSDQPAVSSAGSAGGHDDAS